jgi:hypothetical protein
MLNDGEQSLAAVAEPVSRLARGRGFNEMMAESIQIPQHQHTEVLMLKSNVDSNLGRGTVLLISHGLEFIDEQNGWN